MTVLLVEDDQDIRLIAGMALRQIGGFTVVEAASGAEAIETLASLLPDVVLLDVMMPDMDGTEVLRTIRQTPATAAVPVVFLTAKAMPAELNRLRALGARAILTKPFDPAALPALVRRALETDGVEPLRAPQTSHGPTPDPDTIDLEALRAIARLTGSQSQSLIGELIEMFASTTPGVVHSLREAAGGSGVADAERLAHSLKGSAAALGALGFSSIAAQIEIECRAGRSRDILPLVDDLAAALQPTVAALQMARAQVELKP